MLSVIAMFVDANTLTMVVHIYFYCITYVCVYMLIYVWLYMHKYAVVFWHLTFHVKIIIILVPFCSLIF